MSKLRLEDVTLAYGPRVVLQNISFETTPGEMLGIVGPNGCGKSTLIKGITRVIPLASGRIFIDGRDAARIPRNEMARLVAVVPQNPTLPEAFTAFEVVLMGRTPHLGFLGYESQKDLSIVVHCMQVTSTVHLATRRVGELSGGERQRLTIARALAQETNIVLLDEPTAHLDINYQVETLNLVADLCAQRRLTALVAVHDLNLAAQYCQRIIMISGGIIHAQGTPREVITAENVRRATGKSGPMKQGNPSRMALAGPGSRQPRAERRSVTRQERHPLVKGCVQVYTGNGKGKTTAALGLAFRAAGHGLKTYIGQFMKGQDYGELETARRMHPLIVIEQYGTAGFIHVQYPPSEDDVQRAREGLAKANEAMLSGDYDIVVLDEITTAHYFHLVTVPEMLDLIRSRPEGVELVFTGRYAPPEIIEAADLVTEMREVKHYYDKGVEAREGIEL